MKISQLSKRTQVSAHTLRYYEKVGLLTPNKTSSNNYRSYDQHDLASVQFISRCKQSGFSLEEIRTLLGIKNEKDAHICAEAKAITVAKIDQIRSQIEHLQRMENMLIELSSECCGGNESAKFCSIIARLETPQEDF
jgi:MerR family Zn(II)-responsive transcriptional regulator of zntA